MSISLLDQGCEQSLVESDGFICDSSLSWNERKQNDQSQDKQNRILEEESYFFTSNWEPTFHCTHGRRVGAKGDGGKWVCDPYRYKQHFDCLIYSVGSNGEFSFEIEMKNLLPHCQIHTFDSKPYTCPANVCTFHQITFGDGITPPNSKTWSTVIHELHHESRSIDVLKIDIEGGEYTFFPLLWNSTKSAHPQQILVEVHPTNVTRIHRFFNQFRSNDYVIVSKENNIIAGPYFFEYAFLKLNPLFFLQSNPNSTLT